MWWGKRYTRGCPDMRKQGTHPCAHACVLAANAILPSALTPPPLLSLPPPPFLTPPPFHSLRSCLMRWWQRRQRSGRTTNSHRRPHITRTSSRGTLLFPHPQRLFHSQTLTHLYPPLCASLLLLLLFTLWCRVLLLLLLLLPLQVVITHHLLPTLSLANSFIRIT